MFVCMLAYVLRTLYSDHVPLNTILLIFDFFHLQGGESEHINLKVLGQDNAVVQFKIKKHTPLRKLMNAYCDRAVSQMIKLC